jgi:hypothetical protein
MTADGSVDRGVADRGVADPPAVYVIKEDLPHCLLSLKGVR